MKRKTASKKIPPKEQDPFFGLKYIAYLRSQGIPEGVEADSQVLLDFAKWQICKVRKVLWLDPLWESYTPQEILIEYFSIQFDESEKLRKEFAQELLSPRKSDLDWFAAKEAELLARRTAQQGEGGTIKEGETPDLVEEFEDTYT